MKTKYIVCSEFINIWNENSTPPYLFKNMETQALFGETIASNKNTLKGSLVYLEDQYTFINKMYKKYKGLLAHKLLSPHRDYKPNIIVSSNQAILKPHNIKLSFGSYIKGDIDGNIIMPDGSKAFCNPEHLRKPQQKISITHLCHDALMCLNTPYVWGGRYINIHHQQYGVDCSGLIHLLFKAQGFELARNASDQFKQTIKHTCFTSLPIGGLIFLSNIDTPERINHVMIKTSSINIIDASESTACTRMLCYEQDFSFKKEYMQIHYEQSELKTFCVFFGYPEHKKSRRLK